MTLDALLLALSSAAFAPWQPVTVATILQPVPEFQWTGLPGAVTKQYRNQKPLPDRCAILEAGKVIGYRTACKDD